VIANASISTSISDVFVGMRFPLLFEQAGFRDVGTLGLQVYWPPRSCVLGDAFMSANAVFSLPTVVGGWGRRPE
jgi:hypothetical protein